MAKNYTWDLEAGKCTDWPANNQRRPFQGINLVFHLKSFNITTSASSAPTHKKEPEAGFWKHLYITDSGCKINVEEYRTVSCVRKVI